MRFKGSLRAVGVIAVMLLATVGVAFTGAHTETQKRTQKDNQRAIALQSEMARIVNSTDSRVQGLATALQGTRGAAQRKEFARLATLVLNDPGLSAIGMVLKVPDQQRAAFERSNHLQIKTFGGAPSPVKGTHYVAVQVFGRSVNPRTIGLDLSSDAVRGVATRGAIDRASPYATAPLKLFSGGSGTVLYVPIYKANTSIAALPARRRAAVGVLSVGLKQTLLTSALKPLLPKGTAFQVTDVGKTIAGIGEVTDPTPTRMVTFAGRTWAISAQRTKAPAVPAWLYIAVGGLLLTGAVAIFLIQAIRREGYANRAVDARTSELAEANALLEHQSHFFDLSRDLVCVIDYEGRMVSFNDAWTTQMGWERDELMEMDLASQIHPDDMASVGDQMDALIRGGETVEFRNRRLAKDGSWHWLEWNSVGIPEAGVIYASARDITERVALELDLSEERKQLASAQEIAKLGSWAYDFTANQSYWSKQQFSLFGVEPTETGPTLEAWTDLVHDDDREMVVGTIADAYANGNDFEFIFRLATDNVVGPVHLAISGKVEADTAGRVTRIVGTAMDVSERKRHESILRHLADHDPLTGLANRRRFHEELARHMSESSRYGADGAVMLLDLDRLKQVNDELGHDAGDKLIKAFADTLTDRLRGSDLVARIGGDEFAILVKRGDREAAEAIARDLLESTSRETVALLATGVASMTASIGVVALDRSSPITPDDVIKAADIAMYSAKQSGRNQVVVHKSTADRVADALQTAAVAVGDARLAA